MKKIAIFYGTRPEYLKLKNIIKLIPNNKKDVFFIAQHKELIKNNFFSKKINILKNRSGLNRLNSIISQIINRANLKNYHSVIIQGDTATTLAVAIVAFNFKKKIIYVESGLRSFDFLNPFPEEGYRQMISRIADINLCPTKLSKKNLQNEKVKGKIFVTGNTGLDNLVDIKKKSLYSNIVLITLHRRENIPLLSEWFYEINKIAERHKNLNFILPIHANPEIHRVKKILTNVKVVNYLTHEKLLFFLIKSRFVITDSGGIQEEASFLNKKTIVCRSTTERPEGIKSGHLFLCKNPKLLGRLCSKIIKKYRINKKCPYGNGKSSIKIVNFLKRNKII
jgi:UDP-N-acetylglucosamine 2-epimerase (non-hydrolysing)